MLARLLLSAPPAASPDTVMVAAVVYTGTGESSIERSCAGDSVCAIEGLVREAAGKGARLVVTPEYGFDQHEPEPDPAVGDTPRASRKAPLLGRFGALADELDVYLAIDLQTASRGHSYNTLVAFDPDGMIVGKHHKFELFGGERQRLTPGMTVSAFDTPFGRVGMLICADVYGSPRLHERMVSELGVEVVVMSAMWTAPGATRWQAAFAHDWEVFVVAANRSAGTGRGAGIFDRRGMALTSTDSSASQVLLTHLPKPGRPKPGRGISNSEK